jgi:hypothetical protein
VFTRRLALPDAVLANHCQVHVRLDGGIDFRLVVKAPQVDLGPEQTRAIALDWGLSVLFAAA